MLFSLKSLEQTVAEGLRRPAFSALLSILVMLAAWGCPKLVIAEEEVRFTIYRLRQGTLQIEETMARDARAGTALARLIQDIVTEAQEDGASLIARPLPPLVLRVVSEKAFQRLTGAPAWTAALFRDDGITVAFPDAGKDALAELRRTLRHEYIHFLVAHAAAFRCPAWVDEGAAQLFEQGSGWNAAEPHGVSIAPQTVISFSRLNDGFTTLPPDAAQAAYAQSRFAVGILVRSRGWQALGAYFSKLREGIDAAQAFTESFGLPLAGLEMRLNAGSAQWIGFEESGAGETAAQNGPERAALRSTSPKISE